MEDKLRFHSAAWDLSADLKTGLAAIVVIDARCRDAYIAGHIPGAVSFPHREMNSETTARLGRTVDTSVAVGFVGYLLCRSLLVIAVPATLLALPDG
jgi:3-mercaptopyruvate sulfurtransferase SseA